jgi:hypothetical protein
VTPARRPFPWQVKLAKLAYCFLCSRTFCLQWTYYPLTSPKLKM